jgi:hypothetical protein
MKRLFTILFILALALPAAVQHMLIEKEGSNNEIVSIDNLKRITFNGTIVVVELNDGTKSSNKMSVISSISFGDHTSIGVINPDKDELATYISNDEIAINCKAGSLVTIYNMTGTQVLCIRLDLEYGKINIASLPKGIYIVKVNTKTIKIARR